MKADQLARHYAKVETNLIELNPEMLIKQVKEYGYLYKSVYNLVNAPRNVLSFRLYKDKAYVLKDDYVSFLTDLALIRYKFSRKKYNGGKRKNENQIP